MTVDGVVDFTNQRLSMTITNDLEGAGRSLFRKVIIDGSTLYTIDDRGEEAGAPWQQIDLRSADGGAGAGFGVQATLPLLLGVSADIDEVGSEVIRGADTTHYRATVDVDKAVREASEDVRPDLEMFKEALVNPTLPLDIWLDAHGRVRRQVFTTERQLRIPNPQGGTDERTSEVRTQLELYDFGTDVDIEPPPPDEVIEMPQPPDAES